MLQKAIIYIKNFFFPKFSIAEFITLGLLLLFWLFEILPNLSGALSLPNSIADLLWFLFLFGVFIGGIGYTIYRVIRIALRKDQASLSDKKIFSSIFYTSLSILSLAAALQTVTIFKGDPFQIVELIFIGYIAVKSLVTMLILLLLNNSKSDNMSHIYAVQMEDQKPSPNEILILLIFISTIYLLLKNSTSSLSTIVLTYFYCIILFKLYRSFSKRIIFN
jgi:hypothetical protein